MRSPLLELGAPPDAVAWIALGAAVVALAVALLPPRRGLDWLEQHPRVSVALLAALAALLSAGYLAHYLGGGPRIIDATSYWLEARTLASGGFSFEVLEPSGSFRGRFLLASSDGSALSVIFPPGYPLLLALGFLLGAPLAVGPALAAALVVATYALALQLFGSVRLALFASLLGVLCAALRYHTADTMSHGLGALLLSIALWAALRGGKLALLAGVAIGWLLATRPVTGAAGLVLVLLAARPLALKNIGLIALGLLPGIGLLLAHQHAATGSWLSSTQLGYYALADGPPGCFRFGFGSGIGCVFEHGDFVGARLGSGFGALAAIGTTLRRLQHHLLDVGNAEPLALLVPIAAVIGRGERPVRLLAAGAALLMIAYVPFYFDATYPGGGARLYAEALPLEHVLIAWLLERWRLSRFAPPLALAGFAIHGSFSHVALSEREGGRPMFEPERLSGAGITRGLVFVNTDHGFNLGHAPGSRELVVARLRTDAHDRRLWEQLGRPPSYRYRFDPWQARAEPLLEPFVPPSSERFEAEAEWPPLDVSGGYTHPSFPGARCSSQGAALKLVPTDPQGVDVTLAIFADTQGERRIAAGFADSPGVTLTLDLEHQELREALTTGKIGSGCRELVSEPVRLEPGRVLIRITAEETAQLDYLELRSP